MIGGFVNIGQFGFSASGMSLFSSLSVVLAPPVYASENPQTAEMVPLNPVAFVEMPRLKNPALSDDGNTMVVVQSAVDWAKNKRVDAYNIIDVDTGDVQVLPRDKTGDDRLSKVQWSPDNSGFITLLKREEDKKTAAYFYGLENEGLTKLIGHPENISEVKWYADGRTVYFRARRDDQKTKEDKQREIAPYDVSPPIELWRYQFDKKTSQPVLTGSFSVRGFSLSADDSQIIYSRIPEGAGSALSKNVLLLLGDKDNDPNHKSLRRTPEAMQQGQHRFARGLSYHAIGKEQAERYAVRYGWTVQVASGVAHSNGLMAKAAASIVN